MAIFVKDVLISDIEHEFYNFKALFKEAYKIIKLEKLKRHPGIWNGWMKNEEGSGMIKMHMDNIARNLVSEYGELTQLNQDAQESNELN